MWWGFAGGVLFYCFVIYPIYYVTKIAIANMISCRIRSKVNEQTEKYRTTIHELEEDINNLEEEKSVQGSEQRREVTDLKLEIKDLKSKLSNKQQERKNE